MADSGYFPSQRQPGPFPSTKLPGSKGKIPVELQPDPTQSPGQSLREAIDASLEKLMSSSDDNILRQRIVAGLAFDLEGSLLFPGCKSYEQAAFVGNLLYANLTPAVIVQAVTVEDVVATVVFMLKLAKKKIQLLLTVKSGGHSMGGYCLNEGGIVLDISSMNRVTLNQAAKTVTVQGGALWWDVYVALKGTNLVAIGGNCPTVGVSAFLLGGGVSPYSRSYGLGVDSLLKMTIITSDGKTVTVSREDKDEAKKDLFWAVRGGGGGNFGVTVEVELKLHELPDKLGTVVSGNLIWNLDLEHEKERFDAMMKVWNETKWPNELRGDALWRYDDNFQLLGQMTIVYNGNKVNCDKVIKPLLDFRPSRNELAPMHWTDWESIDGKSDIFEKIYHHHASFIFGQGGITPEVAGIIYELMRNKFITQHEDVHFFILWHHIGGKTEKPEQDTAFFWRKGAYVFHMKVLWTDPKLEPQVSSFLTFCKQQLRPYALDGKAAYLNYIDPTEDDWKRAYYGKNYERLCVVQKYWDKAGFFKSHQGLNQSKDEKSDPKAGKLVANGWAKYALSDPEVLGNPETTDEAFAIAAAYRRSLISHRSE